MHHGSRTPAGCCGESLGHLVTAKYLRKVGERTLVTFCNGSLTSKMNTSKMKWFTRYLTILFFTFFGEPFPMEVELDEFGKVQRYKSRAGSNLSVKNSGRGTHGQCLMLLLKWKIGKMQQCSISSCTWGIKMGSWIPSGIPTNRAAANVEREIHRLWSGGVVKRKINHSHMEVDDWGLPHYRFLFWRMYIYIRLRNFLYRMGGGIPLSMSMYTDMYMYIWYMYYMPNYVTMQLFYMYFVVFERVVRSLDSLGASFFHAYQGD